ncbi:MULTISPECIES: nuclear transport factor 2 family protein [Pseudomonas]|uniref:nuclear transport factor 2 family protein n=1 Tax=Pseudomonas TaxID=286 RepID=UPI0013A757F4|nr:MULTISPECIES: nuclear transport factor 2 family protein [Pseudomonas]QIB51175.1 nuclear transport factor 2 family protein [Pseudomonas sp. OIL-1]
MSQSMLSEVALLIDKQQLHELNVRYCIGVDRKDHALLSRVWAESATIDFGLFRGSASEFCQLIVLDDPAVSIAHHFASNELFEIQGDKATGQSYVIGSSVRPQGDGSQENQLVGGRYLDTYIREEGKWLISRRHFVVDWVHAQVSLADYQAGIAAVATNGKPSTDDIAYSFPHAGFFEGE